MSNETTTTMNTDKKSVSYGAKLRAAREAMGLEQKDIAAQLRLGERIIDMLESGHYLADVPTTFVRGYIRSYSKLLQIPESEVAAALEPIKPAPAPQETLMLSSKQPVDLTSSNYYMQFSTYAIVATLAGMIGLWWYNHAPASQSVVAQNQPLLLPDTQKPIENKEVAATTPGATSTPNTTTNTTTSPAIGAAVAATATTTPAAKPASETKLAAAVRPHHVTRSDDDDEDDDGNHTD